LIGRCHAQSRRQIGLIGSNGAGKSSLFAMLRRAASGSGQYRIPAKWQLAHVAQETPPLERSGD
jgi:ATP-binding cassette subfamily F protein 3